MDSDGELSLPEIERMVQELYGVKGGGLSSMGTDILNDVNHYAEERGGFLSLVSFTCYTMVSLEEMINALFSTDLIFSKEPFNAPIPNISHPTSNTKESHGGQLLG